MKYFYTIILTLLFVSGYSQQNMDAIYGNPKSIKDNLVFLNKNISNEYFKYNSSIFRNISRYRSKNLESFLKKNRVNFISSYREYYENGLLEFEIWYDISDNIEREYYYKYDKRKNLIEKKEVYYDNEYFLTKLHYNSTNKLIANSYYVSDNPNEFAHWYYIRDINNNIIETKSVDEEGENYSIVNKLNQEGEVVKIIRKFIRNWRLPDKKQPELLDSINVLHEFDYDKHANKILELNYNEETGRVYSKKIYKYDNLNNLIEYKIFFQPNDSTKYRITKYDYNESGLKIFEEELSSVDSLYYKSNGTIFNNDGYIIKNIFIEKNDITTTRLKYKFDKKGNWTEITKIVNDEPLCVWTRKITYYKD